MPSKRDSTTAQEIAADTRVELSEPLVLIISQVLSALEYQDQYEAVSCYSWSPAEGRLILAQLLSTHVADKWCG